MIIKNAKVFEKDGTFTKRDLYIEGGRFVKDTDYRGSFADVYDAKGLFAIPGLVDIHFHGCVGCDFCESDETGLERMLEYEASNGVMAVCPTTMTLPESHIEKVIDNMVRFLETKSCNKEGNNYDSAKEGSGKIRCISDVVGINLEGPFISKEKTAAQNSSYIIGADSDMFLRLLKRAKGLIKMVDIAPEESGAMEFIEKFKDKAVISLAHTDADYDTAKRAYEKGARHLTHMFNAMNGIKHREPGPIPAALDMGATVELICDGVHIHDSVIRMAFNMFGDRLVLVSDSMAATGLCDGTYTLGGQSVVVDGKCCILADNPDVIAGSNSNLFECMKYAHLVARIPLSTVIQAATINPAKVIGVDDRYGCLSEGFLANVIIIDENFEIKKLIKGGRFIR